MKNIISMVALLMSVIAPIQAVVTNASKWQLNGTEIVLLGEQHVKSSSLGASHFQLIKNKVTVWNTQGDKTHCVLELGAGQMGGNGLLSQFDDWIKSDAYLLNNTKFLRSDKRDVSLTHALFLEETFADLLMHDKVEGFPGYVQENRLFLHSLFKKYVDTEGDVLYALELLYNAVRQNDFSINGDEARSAVDDMFEKFRSRVDDRLSNTPSVSDVVEVVHKYRAHTESLLVAAKKWNKVHRSKVAFMKKNASKIIEGLNNVEQFVQSESTDGDQRFGHFLLDVIKQECSFDVMPGGASVLTHDYIDFCFLYQVLEAQEKGIKRVVVYAGESHVDALQEAMCNLKASLKEEHFFVQGVPVHLLQAVLGE